MPHVAPLSTGVVLGRLWPRIEHGVPEFRTRPRPGALVAPCDRGRERLPALGPPRGVVLPSAVPLMANLGAASKNTNHSTRLYDRPSQSNQLDESSPKLASDPKNSDGKST